MRGRVNAVNGVFVGASNELGEFRAGVSAGFIGTVPAVVIGGIGTIAVTVALGVSVPGAARSARHLEGVTGARSRKGPSPHSISAKRSTSKRPRSVIFRCGITGSGRKATCRNGSGSVQPSVLRGAPERDQLLPHGLERLEAHQPRHRQRQLGANLAARDDHEAALHRDDAVHRRRHVGIVDADDGDVVAVMPDRRGDRAALQAKAVHEAAADVFGFFRDARRPQP